MSFLYRLGKRAKLKEFRQDSEGNILYFINGSSDNGVIVNDHNIRLNINKTIKLYDLLQLPISIIVILMTLLFYNLTNNTGYLVFVFVFIVPLPFVYGLWYWRKKTIKKSIQGCQKSTISFSETHKLTFKKNDDN